MLIFLISLNKKAVLLNRICTHTVFLFDLLAGKIKRENSTKKRGKGSERENREERGEIKVETS